MRALIFDSGMGGLTVAREIAALRPDIALDYVADDAFRPYGEKSAAQLRARLPGLLRTLEIMLAPDLIVLACNTASVTALGEVRAAVRAPVVGVVPAIKPAAMKSRAGVIAVLGTPGTIARDYVQKLIADFAEGLEVRRLGSVNLVRWAEDKMAGIAPDLDAIRAEIAPLFPKGQPQPDVLVMACTHFPLLAEEIAAAAPPGLTLIDSGAAIARRVDSLLPSRGKRPDPAQNAFLICRNMQHPVASARAQAFAGFGFPRVITLPDFGD